VSRADPFSTSADRGERYAIDYARPTRPQLAYLTSRERYLCWRGGNTIGKTWAIGLDIAHMLRGTSPFRPRPPGPVEILLSGYSFAQMDSVCRAVWEWLPREEVDPKVEYVKGGGFTGYKIPRVPLVRGPGEGSILRLATYGQGGQRVMGMQVDGAYLDEPPPENVYSETIPRLNERGGLFRAGFTPTPESPPLEYMQDEIKAGRLAELVTPYTQENVTIYGGIVPIPRKTQAEIDEQISRYLPDEREMRRTGDWFPKRSGRWMWAITDGLILDSDPLDDGRHWFLAVGVDHGTEPGKQYAGLVATDGERVVVLDEVWRPGVQTTTQEDAHDLLSMLKRNGLVWTDIDAWVGDRRTNRNYFGVRKCNTDLTVEIAKQLGISRERAVSRGLRISVPSKGRGSVRRGFQLINTLAKAGKFHIMRRCEGFRDGADKWEGDPRSSLKDPLDGVRYAVERFRDDRRLRLTHSAA
tara:strand:- start:768 stop:2174 length:1407 start_codon:yes stop_codon:yes gene_type:complete